LLLLLALEITNLCSDFLQQITRGRWILTQRFEYVLVGDTRLLYYTVAGETCLDRFGQRIVL